METRRIVMDGRPITVTREGDELATADGARVPSADARRLPPCEPSKIVCVHLNYESPSRRAPSEAGAAPTSFHKPATRQPSRGRGGATPGCRYLKYEGEIAIVIGERTFHVSPEKRGTEPRLTVANDYGLHDFRDTDAGSCSV